MLCMQDIKVKRKQLISLGEDSIGPATANFQDFGVEVVTDAKDVDPNLRKGHHCPRLGQVIQMIV
jgi:hypothetical protein